MTLDDCFNKYQGTSILIPGGGAGNQGQCVQWTDTVYHEVYGFPYIYTPAAKDWWYNADGLGITANFDKITDGSIKAGDILVWNPVNDSDPQGHIDVASKDGSKDDFWAYDSNWGGATFYKNGYPILHEVHHADRYNQFVIGSLRKKGTDMVSPTQAEVLSQFRSFGVPDPTQEQLDYYSTKDWGTLNGDLLVFVYDRTKELQAQAADYQKLIDALKAQLAKAGVELSPKVQAQLDKIDQTTTDTKGSVLKIIDLILSKFSFSKKK